MLVGKVRMYNPDTLQREGEMYEWAPHFGALEALIDAGSGFGTKLQLDVGTKQQAELARNAFTAWASARKWKGKTSVVQLADESGWALVFWVEAPC